MRQFFFIIAHSLNDKPITKPFRVFPFSRSAAFFMCQDFMIHSMHLQTNPKTMHQREEEKKLGKSRLNNIDGKYLSKLKLFALKILWCKYSCWISASSIHAIYLVHSMICVTSKLNIVCDKKSAFFSIFSKPWYKYKIEKKEMSIMFTKQETKNNNNNNNN